MICSTLAHPRCDGFQCIMDAECNQGGGILVYLTWLWSPTTLTKEGSHFGFVA